MLAKKYRRVRVSPKTKQPSDRITRRQLFKLVSGLVITALFFLHRRTKTTKAESPTGVKPSKTVISPQIKLNKFDFETLTINEVGQITSRTNGQAQYFVEDLGNGVTLDMVAIGAGTFQMGSPPEEQGNFTDSERPQHLVTVPSFYIGKYPITQAQWKAVASLPKINLDLTPDPSHFKGDNLPVEQVSWYEAVEFCARVSQYTGKPYQLPSEAQWEYACRAGSTTPFYFGPTLVSQIANYYAESDPYAVEPASEYRRRTTPVGSFFPNAFGLYDLHGSVYEWCADPWHKNYEQAPNDASVWTVNPYQGERYRVLRGGGWSSEARQCRSAKRYQFGPKNRYSVIGFRIVAV